MALVPLREMGEMDPADRPTAEAGNAAPLKEAEKELSGRGAPVMTVIADVEDTATVTEALRQVQAWSGQLDILVNCAGPRQA